MAPPPTTDVYACSDCGNCQADAQRCARCKGEPMLDLREENVRAALVQEDDARKASRDGRVRMISVVLAVLVGAVLCLTVPGIALLGMSFFGSGFIVGGIVLSLLMMAIVGAILPWKPRFPQLRL